MGVASCDVDNRILVPDAIHGVTSIYIIHVRDINITEEAIMHVLIHVHVDLCTINSLLSTNVFISLSYMLSNDCTSSICWSLSLSSGRAAI